MKALLFVAGLVLAGQAQAQASAVLVVGAGTTSCGNVVKAVNAEGLDARLVREWARGYITGMSYYAQITNLSKVDNASMDLFLARYCTNNPLHNLVFATAALVGEIGGPKSAHTYVK